MELVKLEILGSELIEQEIRVNLGDALTGTGVSQGASLWAADGFVGRPNNPSDAGACMGIYQIDGNDTRVIATKDNRFIDAYAELEPGDRAIVTDGPARLFLKRAQSSIALYTEDSDGNPYVLDVSGENGAISIVASDGSNSAVLSIEPTKVVIQIGKDTQVLIDKDGLAVYGKHTALNSNSGNLGPAGAIGAQSIIYGTSGVSGVPSAAWTVGI